MRRLLFIMIVLGGVAAVVGQEERRETPREQQVVFRAMELWVDSGANALAAYQVELRYNETETKIVGLEGGETAAFNPAPYYDPAGMESGRIVVAAFTADDATAPSGRTRVARIHFRVEGADMPVVAVKLMTAAKPGGARISPKLELLATSEAKGE